MRSCPGHRVVPTPPRCPGEQQLKLSVLVEADPLVEVAAAKVLILAMDQMRSAGIMVHQVRVELENS